MRKNLLALAAATMLTSGTVFADTWSVIGTFNNWDGDVEMSEVTDGVFSVTMESIQGEFKFRANHDWTVNYGASFSFDITGNASDIAMARDGMNFNAPAELADVTFTIDTNNATLSISGLSSDMDVVPPVVTTENIYLIGEPAGEWNTGIGIEMAKIGDGLFTWTGYLTEGEYFGFVSELNNDGDWDVFNAHRYGPLSDGDELLVNEVNAVTYPSSGAWRVALSGTFVMTLDIRNLTLNVQEKAPDTWGLIGAFNGWNGDLAMEQSGFDPNVYSVTVDSLVGDFKFRANGSWGFNFGASNESVITSDGVYGMATDGANFSFLEEVKNVTLSINVYAWTLTVSGLSQSGIEGIDAGNDEPVYFNLHGVKVANPEKGMFIRVVNGKAMKVAL